jgi:hypothetical protein
MVNSGCITLLEIFSLQLETDIPKLEKPSDRNNQLFVEIPFATLETDLFCFQSWKSFLTQNIREKLEMAFPMLEN